MQEKRTVNKNLLAKIIIASTVLVLAIVGTILYFSLKDKPNENLKTISLVIYFSDEESYSYELETEKGYVFDLLAEHNEGKDLGFKYEVGQYGASITAFKGKDVEYGYYFALYVNGEYANFGISEQIINDGDEIKFIYESWL